MPENTFERVLDGTTCAASVAREFVAKTLPGNPRLDDLISIVSELVANAVRHSRSGQAGGRLRVVVGEGVDFTGAQFACVKVIDDGPRKGHDGVLLHPQVRHPRDGAESGYGLALVAALSDRWGHYCGPRQDRRTVWAAVDVPPARSRSE